MSRRFVRILLIAGLISGLSSSPASAGDPTSEEIDPFPLGVCLKATKVHPRPICVLIVPDHATNPDLATLDLS